MGKPLTPELVLTRSKADRLENVKNLNLWGNDLEDVKILREMPNVEVLSLSVNKISSLRDFRYCNNLSELYLRKNLISDLSEIRYLQALPNLKVLWLWDNPCAEHPDYRSLIIRQLPNLVKLDNQAITPEERASAMSSAPTPPPATPPPEPAVKREPVRPSTSAERRQNRRPKPEHTESRNENILCAVLALLKELDESGLELVKRDIERKLSGRTEHNAR
jgi:Leucine-rich repeat (LRR) protein